VPAAEDGGGVEDAIGSTSLSSLAGGSEEMAAGGSADIFEVPLPPFSSVSDSAYRFVCLRRDDWYDLLHSPDRVRL